MPPAARSVEELFPLIEFCKNGDLKAVSDWIAKGNPLDLPPGKKPRRASPLQIAIEKGFLTLTEILLDGGADPASNGNALWIAVRAKRIDIVRLLLGERPIVKRNDIKAYGRYRTMETILQIYDALEEAARTGVPYQTRLDPPPADPAIGHAPQPIAAAGLLEPPP